MYIKGSIGPSLEKKKEKQCDLSVYTATKILYPLKIHPIGGIFVFHFFFSIKYFYNEHLLKEGWIRKHYPSLLKQNWELDG